MISNNKANIRKITNLIERKEVNSKNTSKEKILFFHNEFSIKEKFAWSY